jgi:NAD(P)-dependent dehydrogenase (short-subunit alcohol dehydrogenase family)
MNKVWLVTGLGRNISEAVLESGDQFVATARDPKRLDDWETTTAIAFARSFWTCPRRVGVDCSSWGSVLRLSAPDKIRDPFDMAAHFVMEASDEWRRARFEVLAQKQCLPAGHSRWVCV